MVFCSNLLVCISVWQPTMPEANEFWVQMIWK